MKKHLAGAVTAALTFIIALAIGSLRLHEPQHSEEPVQPALSTQAEPATSDSSEESCISLIDDNPFHSKLNGWRLPQGSEPLSEDEIDAAKVIPISSGGFITDAGDVLSRFDSQKRVVWEFDISEPLFDFDVVESTGLVYGTAGDNIMFILDLSSGKELKVESRNGKAAYGQVSAYGTNECLVLDNFWGYREGLPSEFEPMKDGVTAWRGIRELWHRDFPPDAELVVKGKQIFAVTKTKTTVYIKEIFPPSKSK